jgi:hypothetical protein
MRTIKWWCRTQGITTDLSLYIPVEVSLGDLLGAECVGGVGVVAGVTEGVLALRVLLVGRHMHLMQGEEVVSRGIGDDEMEEIVGKKRMKDLLLLLLLMVMLMRSDLGDEELDGGHVEALARQVQRVTALGTPQNS